MKQSYQNHKKNLNIKATISNFIIIILLLEFLDNISYAILLLPTWLEYFNIVKDANRFPFLFRFQNYTSMFVLVIRQTFVPVLSLLMNYLWLIYRKYEYKYSMLRWLVYIVVRSFVASIFSFVIDKPDNIIGDPGGYSSLLWCLSASSFGCFYIFDFVQFICLSRKFYLHLKSREKEIRLFYFDDNAYLESKFLRIHFKMATILVVFALFFFTLGFSLWSFLEPVNVMADFLRITNPLLTVVSTAFVAYICLPSIIIYKLLITANYLYIFIVIIYKACRDRQKLAHINNNIKPLIEKYQNTIYYRNN